MSSKVEHRIDFTAFDGSKQFSLVDDSSDDGFMRLEFVAGEDVDMFLVIDRDEVAALRDFAEARLKAQTKEIEE